jgi:hypothetical protein
VVSQAQNSKPQQFQSNLGRGQSTAMEAKEIPVKEIKREPIIRNILTNLFPAIHS